MHYRTLSRTVVVTLVATIPANGLFTNARNLDANNASVTLNEHGGIHASYTLAQRDLGDIIATIGEDIAAAVAKAAAAAANDESFAAAARDVNSDRHAHHARDLGEIIATIGEDIAAAAAKAVAAIAAANDDSFTIAARDTNGDHHTHSTCDLGDLIASIGEDIAAAVAKATAAAAKDETFAQAARRDAEDDARPS